MSKWQTEYRSMGATQFFRRLAWLTEFQGLTEREAMALVKRKFNRAKRDTEGICQSD